MIRTWNKSTRIALVVMISIMMVVSSFAPVCTAFAEEGTEEKQTEATETAKEKSPAPQPKEQKQEPKEEAKEIKAEPEETTKEEPEEGTNEGQSQGTNEGSGQEQTGSNSEAGSPSSNEGVPAEGQQSIYGIIGEEEPEDIDKYARYTYRFYVNGELVDTQIVKEGEKVYEPTRPAGSGFTGWTIEGEGTALSFPYDPGIPSNATEDRTFDVKASFEDTLHAIFYKDAERSSILQIKSGRPGESVSTGDVTFRFSDGKRIIGWRLAGGNRVDQVEFNDSDVELLPVLSREAVQVTFVTGEGTPVAPVYVEKGEKLSAPSEPTRSGYDFGGWYRNDACTESYDFGSEVNEPLTLYAGWVGKETKYRVVYWKQNANDDGYSFVEMVDRKGNAGTAATYDQKSYDGFTLSAARTNGVVLIAGDGTTIKNVYYDRKTYPLEFYLYKQVGSSWFGPTYDWVKKAEKNFKYEEDTSEFWATVNKDYPGYYWKRGTGENDAIIGDAKPMPIGGMKAYGYTGNQKSHLVFLDEATNKEIRSKYEFGNADWNFKNYVAPVIPGFSFSKTAGPGWTGKGKDRVYEGKVYYTRNKYGMQFVTNGGTAVAPVTGIPFEASLAAYKPSSYTVGETTKTVNDITYTFAGWYSDESLQSEFNFSGTMPALEVTINANRPNADKSTLVLYAKWTAGEHTVSYDLNGGTFDGGTSIASQAVESGKTVTAPDETRIAKDGGYAFAYWVDENGKRFSFDTAITRDIELTAQWNIDNTKILSVVYDVNGGLWKNGTPITDGANYQAGSYAVVKGQPLAAADSGKYFSGWKVGNTGLIIVGGSFELRPEDANANGVVTLVAQYSDVPLHKTDVIYNANGGAFDSEGTTEIIDTDAVINGEYIVKGHTPTRDDYDFLGWSINPEAKAANIKANNKVSSGSSKNILYAVWYQEENTDPEDPEKPDDPENPDDPTIVDPPEEDPKEKDVKEKEDEPVEKKVKDEYKDVTDDKGAGTVKAANSAPAGDTEGNSVKTGDEHLLALYIALMLAALFAAMVTIIRRSDITEK